MAIKVLIKRRVPLEKARETITLFRQLRILATAQTGYISGETLRSLDRPEEFIVIGTWQSPQDWKNWLASPKRKEIQSKSTGCWAAKPLTTFTTTGSHLKAAPGR